MKSSLQRPPTAAITRWDVLILVVILGVMAAFFLPVLGKTDGRGWAYGVACMNNLRQIGVALHEDQEAGIVGLWASVSGAGASRSTSSPYAAADLFRSLSNRLSSPHFMACPTTVKQYPADFAQLSRTNLSYFAALNRPGTNDAVWLAGDRTLTLAGKPAPSGHVAISTNQLPGWSKAGHPRQRGGMLFADAHSEICRSERLRATLLPPQPEMVRILIP